MVIFNLIGANHAYLLSIILFSVGLASLLQKNIWILKLVQIVGIIFLLYLAYMQWRKKPLVNSVKILVGGYRNWCSLYLKGALIAFSNPKTILLFSIVFPQFVSGEGGGFSQIIILGLTFLMFQFSSGCVYFLFGRRMRGAIEKPGFQNMINKISAAILVVVAGFLLYRL